MSRRESCVWHPMPEEVRRSSIQSRRASLAAGRRASLAKDEPDWEVEAAPAAPAQTRAAPVAEDTYPTEEPAAAVAEEPAPAAAEEDMYPTEEPAQAECEPTPMEEAPAVEQEEPAQAQREPTPIEEAPAVVQEEPENAVAREPVEEASHEPVEDAAPAPAPKKNTRAKTRHTIHFRGSKWNEVKDSNPEGLRAAFLEDIKEGAGVEAEEATAINFDVKGAMTATFMMYHPRDDRTRMEHVHSELQAYAFPKVCALYPPVSDDDEEL